MWQDASPDEKKAYDDKRTKAMIKYEERLVKYNEWRFVSLFLPLIISPFAGIKKRQSKVSSFEFPVNNYITTYRVANWHYYLQSYYAKILSYITIFYYNTTLLM